MQQGCDRTIRSSRTLIGIGLGLILAVVGILITTATTPARASDARLKQVAGVLPGLHLAHLLHPAGDAQRLSIGVGIARPDTAGELAL